MIPVRESVTIAAPLASVWPLLRDPHTIASCIPGAELAPDSGDGLWRGSVRVKFGSTVAIFRGEAKLFFDDEAKRCTIEGRGIDQRGASRALSSLDISASGAETTVLDIDGGFSVTGPLGTFANAGGVHVMRALLAEFSTNIAAAVAGTSPAVTSPPAATDRPEFRAFARELSAGRLLRLSILSWLRSLFRGRNK